MLHSVTRRAGDVLYDVDHPQPARPAVTVELAKWGRFDSVIKDNPDGKA
ncbi:hypothetical protein Enr13x_57960 [Stieleria neptunia]|uniref:Uncharacterized protein n=1 Tax=Stieleria neptunia TaxID=2527979 RepID=A0A518HYG2_9BACT|nr:hypothetical protein Enr13x_57960 [Stieleria neptunia]